MNHMMMNVFVVVELSRHMDTKKKESFIRCIVVVQLHDMDFLILTFCQHAFSRFLVAFHNDVEIDSVLWQLVSRPNLPQTHRLMLFDEHQIEARDDGRLGRDSSR